MCCSCAPLQATLYGPYGGRARLKRRKCVHMVVCYQFPIQSNWYFDVIWQILNLNDNIFTEKGAEAMAEVRADLYVNSSWMNEFKYFVEPHAQLTQSPGFLKVKIIFWIKSGFWKHTYPLLWVRVSSKWGVSGYVPRNLDWSILSGFNCLNNLSLVRCYYFHFFTSAFQHVIV